MRMRTQAEVMAYIREQDPHTAITPCGLRTKILKGEIPSVAVGRKRLIDLDTLEKYLTPKADAKPDIDKSYGIIRPINIAR